MTRADRVARVPKSSSRLPWGGSKTASTPIERATPRPPLARTSVDEGGDTGDAGLTGRITVHPAGYGFVVQLGELYANKKAGKTTLRVPEGGTVVPAAPIGAAGTRLAAASTDGRLLVFPLKELPELSKGKGNKIIGIPGDRVASREEYLTDLAVLPVGATLVLQAGKRTLSLRADDLEHYKGERGRRGNKLPRGFQRVDALQVESLA